MSIVHLISLIINIRRHPAERQHEDTNLALRALWKAGELIGALSTFRDEGWKTQWGVVNEAGGGDKVGDNDKHFWHGYTGGNIDFPVSISNV